SLMPIGINWIFGLPVGATAPRIVDPAQQAWLDAAIAAGGAPEGMQLAPTVPNPAYASGRNVLIAVFVLGTILLVSRFAKGFLSNISVLIGILVGGVLAATLGMMHFDHVAQAAWFAPIKPFHFGMPTFDPIMIATMVLVMLVTLIESTGMFLALSDMCRRPMKRTDLAAGLRADGLGTMIGGIFNTFPYTSFSQNVGLVGVTGIRSRFVCVAGGAILIVLGLIPKMGALVEALPTTVLGGAGLVMFGMVAATGVRILGRVDFAGNRHNLFIVAISVGLGMIPMVAPHFNQWMPKAIHPLIHSGILLAAISAVLLNWFYNGAPKADEEELRAAAKAAEAH
ncbi:MAG: solute carrier family 23 protein, partial [Paracoccus sp. (in: a-proteobacteria)]|nr:solute carrier family 23 protein [Paracoccus sp. (in: a-proteobacteria)]